MKKAKVGSEVKILVNTLTKNMKGMFGTDLVLDYISDIKNAKGKFVISNIYPKSNEDKTRYEINGVFVVYKGEFEVK